MKSASDVLTALKRQGNAQTRKIYARHGAPAEQYGVKVGDLKEMAKKIRGQQTLAYELYETGNADAMYLAGLVADGAQMSKRQLEAWAKAASWYMLAEYTVPGVAVESTHGHELALKWISSRKELVAACGWCTYAGLVAVTPDDDLFLSEIKELMDRIVKEIHTAPNRVRYTMNGFIISVGAYVTPLLRDAKSAAQKIGAVSVDMGETACKTPLATEYIEKIELAGRVGKKRKSFKC